MPLEADEVLDFFEVTHAGRVCSVSIGWWGGLFDEIFQVALQLAVSVKQSGSDCAF